MTHPSPAPPGLYLLDPEPAPAWTPFAGARPLSELRAGAHLIRERWEAFVGAATTEIMALPHLAGFVEPGVPPVTARHPIAGAAIIGSSTFAPRGIAPAFPDGPFRLSCKGVTVGWGVGPGATWDGPQPHAAAVEVSGVVFDTTAGPVVLESGVDVRAGTRLDGPLWAGANTQLLGGPIKASAIGPHCKIRGELASCAFLGYANKAHDGFVGSSVIGRWANLGAGTITSNLKNTYGAVRLDVAATSIETGLQFLGSLIGDHAKTAIGTLLATGTVIGVGANVFDAVRPPKYVPPFAWGAAEGARPRAGAARVTREGFLTIAERVLRRRDVPMDDATRALFGRIYDWATR